MHLGDWENAEKELALSSGTFIIAGCFPGKNENSLILFLAKLVPLGAILFSITIISFGIDHFLYAKDVADYIPSWIPNLIFWAYFAGAALLGSGVGIMFKIKQRLVRCHSFRDNGFYLVYYAPYPQKAIFAPSLLMLLGR